jgi:hypothetical protein
MLHVLAVIGSAAHYSISAAAELAEANAWLLTHPDGAVICRTPFGEDYAVRIVVSLQGLCAAHLLEKITALSEAAAWIQRDLQALRVE